KIYRDAQLDALIDEGLAGSPSVAIADARLARARSFQDSSRGALAPQVSARWTTTAEKQSYNYLSPAEMTPHGWNDYRRASRNFPGEIAFGGRTRAGPAAAPSDAVAAAADADQARLTLSTAIASNYAELARLYSALDTAKAARELRTKTAELFGKRYANGLE